MMEAALTRTRLKLAVFFLVTFHLKTDLTEAMQVTSSGPQTIQKAQGENVLLGCTYTPGVQDIGELDIEWSNVSPDMTQKDKLLLTYTGGRIHNYDPSLSSRLRFIGDPKQGDASISLSNVRLSDTATYQCKVKKAPGVDMRKVTLVVMVPPSVPKCWVDGKEEKGSPVSLLCKSSQGSSPLTYTWTRESGGTMPTVMAAADTGELLIKNHSDSYAGSYVCEAKNPVGKTQCRYSLKAHNPTNKVGVIVGAVIGALLLLLLLLLLIWLLVCCCHKRRYEKEVANEIKEDTHAPESQPPSRNSSYRSVLGYRTHQGVSYSSVGNRLPSVNESNASHPSNSDKASKLSAAAAAKPLPRLQYDHRYGYPV
ncbi:V-set and immunoglobulin domain-containing protein 8b isoform X1 [Dunckerocampus dactyliophorus]|uniref:V-set and immunoglobulin domain-containing protein 8b isoform X1 n=2 Tax=Dunckerocampus dactyliophorus TaxID=161453 RepID=UPI002406702A|nr:V-set and immunoglobulin domain-containing protein 8b isoform X1 [Dunckerocampus dactyliophorus]